MFTKTCRCTNGQLAVVKTGTTDLSRQSNGPVVTVELLCELDEVTGHLGELADIVVHTVPAEQTMPKHLVHGVLLGAWASLRTFTTQPLCRPYVTSSCGNVPSVPTNPPSSLHRTQTHKELSPGYSCGEYSVWMWYCYPPMLAHTTKCFNDKTAVLAVTNILCFSKFAASFVVVLIPIVSRTLYRVIRYIWNKGFTGQNKLTWSQKPANIISLIISSAHGKVWTRTSPVKSLNHSDWIVRAGWLL